MEAFINGYLLTFSILQVLLEFCFILRYQKLRVQKSQLLLVGCLTIFVFYVLRLIPSMMLNLFIHLFYLVLVNRFCFKNSWYGAILSSFIAYEILQLTLGILNTGSCLLSPYVYTVAPDLVAFCFLVFPTLFSLFFSFFCYILLIHSFTFDGSKVNRYAFFALTPLFLIFLTEEYIIETVYGNSLVLTPQGEIIGIQHWPMLIIQILALCSLFCVLYAYRKLLEHMEVKKQLAMLLQETHMQKTYVDEAKARYDQTKAFRHDIKNHFTVLKGFLESDQPSSALAYLKQLDGRTASLDFTYQTNHPVLNILLESKLELARQNGIQIDCTITIPTSCSVDDLDFCVVFSNALDNAIQACMRTKPDTGRFIQISGRQQGDFLMIEMKNNCPAAETGKPPFGIGLSNIQSVAFKYDGALSVERQAGLFCLNVLFIL